MLPGLSRLLVRSSSACLNRSFVTSTKIPNVLIKTQKISFNLKLNNFHSGLNLRSEDLGKKSIINAPNSQKSILSDDLNKIMSQNLSEKEPSKESESSQKQNEEQPKGFFSKMFSKEHAWKVSLTFFTAMFGGSVVYVLLYWGSPKLDEKNQPIKDEFSDLPFWIQYPKRAFNAVLDYYQMMKDPSTDKLLPEPIQPPYYQPPYTLIIEMSGILLHPEWTFSTGWRYKKRPGMDYFIDQIKYPLFEVVLFTREPFLSGAPIAASLDPEQKIHHKLFRESTKFIDNNYVKDLSYMNRDLSKIIVIDWDEKSYQLQARNALHRLKKWEGDESDTDLVYLASFLKMIAASGVNDVRDVLDHYNKEINPLETFKTNQVKLKEAEHERQQIEQEMKQKKSSFSLFRR